MSFVSYVASRNIIPLSNPVYLVEGNDVSFANADNSINSSTLDLSGLSANHFVYVTGSASNDGWHKVVSSTTTKIVTDVAYSVITTEAVGADLTIDGYEHGLNGDYNLAFKSQSINPGSKPIRHTNTSLSGIHEGILDRIEKTWDLTTTIVDEADLKYWHEFFDSVAAYESFSLDLYGDPATPDQFISVYLEGNPRFRRVDQSDYFYISFKVREV